MDAVKSKRYTRTRIDRMILCAFLGLTREQMGVVPSTVRVLGFSSQGRQILRAHPEFRNAGEDVSPEELRLGSLYGLFSTQTPDAPDAEAKRRIFIAGRSRSSAPVRGQADRMSNHSCHKILCMLY